MSQVQIVEVGPRDGLQNEKTPVPTSVKAEFIRNLAAAGLQEIEVSSFVSPKWVPQLADSQELFQTLQDLAAPKLSALVPNLKGLERALQTNVSRIALFTAASDAFTQNNINMTVEESLAVFQEVFDAFKQARPDGWVRGYVSCIVQDPFSGPGPPAAVARVTERLFQIGVDEVSLGETVGVAAPQDILPVAQAVEAVVPQDKIAWHFHDTRGTAVACVAAMLERGYRRFDSSAAGLGGCPYAPGAGGNLATEDLVYFCERSGLKTGVDLPALAKASLPVLEALAKPPAAKSQLALLAECK